MPKIIKIKIKKETLKRILRRVNGGMEGRMDGRVGDFGWMDGWVTLARLSASFLGAFATTPTLRLWTAPFLFIVCKSLTNFPRMLIVL